MDLIEITNVKGRAVACPCAKIAHGCLVSAPIQEFMLSTLKLELMSYRA